MASGDAQAQAPRRTRWSLLAQARALPVPSSASVDNFVAVVRGAPGATRQWVFFRQLANSLVVSAATAAVAVAIATPAAYALARFRFVGSDASMKVLLATQMFPGVATAVPLYMILDALRLLDTRTGLALVYATTAVPFAVFQLRVASSLYWSSVIEGLYLQDAWMGLIKPFALGFAIVTIGCHVGLRTRGGTQGVGRATTNAVVASSVAVIAVDFFVTRLLITLLY